MIVRVQSDATVICDVPTCENSMDDFDFWSIEIKGAKLILVCDRCKDNLVASCSTHQILFDYICLN